MYFEIENTPEHVRRARRSRPKENVSPKEERSLLLLAPFTKPPVITFNDIIIGSCTEMFLDVFNPGNFMQEISVDELLPQGLIVTPDNFTLDAKEQCQVTFSWKPLQTTTLRKTIKFFDANHRAFEVLVVLKTALNPKKNKKKSSPGKIVKNKVAKRSNIYKRKPDEYSFNKTSNTPAWKSLSKDYDKENFIISDFYKSPIQHIECPFDTSSVKDIEFNTSEIFSSVKVKESKNILQETFDKQFTTINNKKNILTVHNMVADSSQIDQNPTKNLWENLTFTPLKTENYQKGPDIDVNNVHKKDVNMKKVNNCMYELYNLENTAAETPINKVPNTSSPKEFFAPNFSINTEYSRISDLSFFPPRFSTEKKNILKVQNDTRESDMLDFNFKISSDTFTKESPNYMENYFNQLKSDYKHFSKESQPKACRQSLFKEGTSIKNNDNPFMNLGFEQWPGDLKINVVSPPRSVTPPLQTIPEENTQILYSRTLDNTEIKRTTFTINRTFEKNNDQRNFSFVKDKESWNKTAVRCEPELWKVSTTKPKSVKKALVNDRKSNINLKNDFNTLVDCSIGDVYSKSLVTDPFLSSIYFYDKDKVVKFENEFKSWLNYILTPAGLESNDDQKIDIGKAWIETKNKEIPFAPTKEQICGSYNSLRLESLRKSARVLWKSPEIAEVIQKLNLQIDKKNICIRPDKNLHLDIGLQKMIMELLLCYNPLWLRLGLESIFNLIIPLKSNHDFEGLTIFIIQRVFKCPNKNKNACLQNVLTKTYMEAIKKHNLKKLFALVFFLDRIKQKRLIPHDPCLFRRNAIYKESQEIIYGLTRELIAGIGNIVRHLRPFGYVVSHKQSYLDEYKYGVNNIALDIRDGVRLTKVMEIILMKDDLLSQLRTPPVSRLQRIHNVQVALNALRDVNFAIAGDIKASDIVDGHREKTLSLLWQLIHVFRAPLFEKAAIKIQEWWRKKLLVILEERKLEMAVLQTRINAATVIKRWWIKIKQKRLREMQRRQALLAIIVIQKYFRMWTCRRHYKEIKSSVCKIEQWYISVKKVRAALNVLKNLRREREHLINKSAVTIQKNVKTWLCVKRFNSLVKKVVYIQSAVRCLLARKQYLRTKQSVLFIQRKYKGKLLMRLEMQKLAETKNSAVRIQSYFRMFQQRRYYKALKRSVFVLEQHRLSVIEMRNQRSNYLKLCNATVLLQSVHRRNVNRIKYLQTRSIITKLQQRVRANFAMRKERHNYLKIKKATLLIQERFRMYLLTKKTRQLYTTVRDSTIVIQRYYRSYLQMKSQRDIYTKQKAAAIVIQKYYRSVLAMRKDKLAFLKLKNAAICIQRYRRANILRKKCEGDYKRICSATVLIQRKYRATLLMREERNKYLNLRAACVTIQSRFRAYKKGRQQRNVYLNMKEAAIAIQHWYRLCQLMKQLQNQFKKSVQATVIIQRSFRSYLLMKRDRERYLRIRNGVLVIQKHYRSYRKMKETRMKYVQLRKSAIIIQKRFKALLTGRQIRETYLRTKSAATLIQKYYRSYRTAKVLRQDYLKLKKATCIIQERYRMLLIMRKQRVEYLTKKTATILIQRHYRALLAMRAERQHYLKLHSSVIFIQRKFRAKLAGEKERALYLRKVQACTKIQSYYRSYKEMRCHRERFVKLKQYTIKIQLKYRAFIIMRIERQIYLQKQSAAICIQKHMRGHIARKQYKKLKDCVVFVQKIYRGRLLMRRLRFDFLQKRNFIIQLQAVCRGYLVRKNFAHYRDILVKKKEEKLKHKAATKIQALYRGHKVRQVLAQNKRLKECRKKWGEKRAMAICTPQKTLREQNFEIMTFFSDHKYNEAIKMFRLLEKLTSVYPEMYIESSPYLVDTMFKYIPSTNRSMPCVDLLDALVSILVNLVRYRKTGPRIYQRHYIAETLKYMSRFAFTQEVLVCKFCTYLWLFAKYEDIKEDLTVFLQLDDNPKILKLIQLNIERKQRMSINLKRSKPNLAHVLWNNTKQLPTLEPEYGIYKPSKNAYFEHPLQAITVLRDTFNLYLNNEMLDY